MGTLIAIEELVAANFLRTDQKFHDWAYETCKHLRSFKDDGINKSEEQIYWLGSIPLFRANTKGRNFIQFTNNNWEFEFDGKFVRDVAGATLSTKRNEFDFLMIRKTLDEQTKVSYKNFNVLIKETVSRYGTHSISLIFNQSYKGSRKYGISSEKAWFNMPVADLQREIKTILEGSVSMTEIFRDEVFLHR